MEKMHVRLLFTGLGLKSIQAIVEKYNGSMIYNYNEDHKIFTVSILVMAQANTAS